MNILLPKRTKLVIFDLDGTLYDKKGLPFRLVLSQLGHLSLLRSERKVRRELAGRFFGSEDAFYEAFFGRLSALCNCSAEVAQQWYETSYMPAMVRILKKHYRVRKGWQEMIGRLRDKGIRIAVLSDYGCVKEKLEALGFDLALADGIYSCPSIGALKPAVETFLGVAARMNVQPEDCLAVGDREDTDGRGAFYAGIPCYILGKKGKLYEYRNFSL